MSNEEDISHLERKIDQLQQHLAQQDAEILRISKVTDVLVQRIKRLQDRMSESGIDSPVDSSSPIEDSPPPHY